MATSRTSAKSRNSVNKRTAGLLSSSLKTIQEGAASNAADAIDSTIEEQLAQAKASRNQAETARQKIANEILEATKEVCQKLISDGEQTLERAKRLETDAVQKQHEASSEQQQAHAARAEAEAHAQKVKAEAQNKAQQKLDQAQATRTEAENYRDRVMSEVQQQAQDQLNQAQTIRHEADAYREKAIADSKEQGQEILYLARSSAEQECTELKRQASPDAQRTIAEAELIKAAAQEELEAQRIYSEAARLEAESLEVLAQVRAKLADPSKRNADGSDWEDPLVQLNASWQNVEPWDESVIPAAEDPAPVVEPQPASPSNNSRSRRPRSSSKK